MEDKLIRERGMRGRRGKNGEEIERERGMTGRRGKNE